jgi:hypothetical protein
MQTLAAAQALRDLLDNPERNDWNELIAANRALIKVIETDEPMTRRNARVVAEYLREAGCRNTRSVRPRRKQAPRHRLCGFARPDKTSCAARSRAKNHRRRRRGMGSLRGFDPLSARNSLAKPILIEGDPPRRILYP